MSNFIQDITIRNFKSLKKCSITGCRRINLFIGRPNVGKSNILEALSLFSIPFLRENDSTNLTQLIRVENETELFFNGDVNIPISVETNLGNARVSYNKLAGLIVQVDTFSNTGVYFFDEKLNIQEYDDEKTLYPIRKYTFRPNNKEDNRHHRYLMPPFGANIFGIIERDKQLKREVSQLFEAYDLQLLYEKASQSYKIIQSKSDNEMFLVPYNSIADTLQRIIFFKTAVASNDDCVLLFEEPEAHSFPPYMSNITQEMIHKKNNQYFVATHSPFIINDFLENYRDELAVFMLDYKNHETSLRKLSDKELHEVYQNGVDLLTNSESYI